MNQLEIDELDLIAGVDALVAQVKALSEGAPDWPAARHAQALLRRVLERVGRIQLKIEAPLVVAMLGGTGTGKSSLVNALVGEEVTTVGRERPTTHAPLLIGSRAISPEMLGIPPEDVRMVHADADLTKHLVLIDCPDPDTTENALDATENLARLRRILPHADVLIVTSTQQKYKSAKVHEELTRANVGARLVFVQTHADQDDDIRADWHEELADEFPASEIFFIDSNAALREAQAGLAPRGDFARLLRLLTHELALSARTKIRRANLLDLVEQALVLCKEKLDADLPAVAQLSEALAKQRAALASDLANRIHAEVAAGRRAWEGEVLRAVTSRWGFSPFSCLLRLYCGIGGALSFLAFSRVRTTGQLALWGMWEGVRHIKGKLRGKPVYSQVKGIRAPFNDGELMSVRMVLDGFAEEAGLGKYECTRASLADEARMAASQKVEGIAASLRSMVQRLAQRHASWWVRIRYEFLLGAFLAAFVYRWGKNFFYDSWLAHEFGRIQAPLPLLGFDFYLGTMAAVGLWCGLLLWLFTGRLRRGFTKELAGQALSWGDPASLSVMFRGWDKQIAEIHAYADRIQQRLEEVKAMQWKLAQRHS